MLETALAWIAASPVAAALKSSRYAYPVVNAVHIMGLAALFGSIVTLDLRLLGAFRTVPARALATALPRVAAFGLVVAILSGAALFSVEPADYAANRAFLIKLALVLIGAAHAIAVHFTGGWRDLVHGRGGIDAGLRLSAAISLAIWTSAILAGRFIAF